MNMTNMIPQRNSFSHNGFTHKQWSLCRSGFECPHCGFHHLLSDQLNGQRIIDVIRVTNGACAIACPECDKTHTYLHTDVRVFGTGNKA
jgi:predicted RNA-binding Zn-ribbon protein involved in translation (DUF1610 family)